MWRKRELIMLKVKKIGLMAAAVAASAVLVAGCGGSQASFDAHRAGDHGTLQSGRDMQDVITASNFESIAPGASVSDVAALYGKEGKLVHQSIINGIYTYTYRWQDGPYKVVDCTFTENNRLNDPFRGLSLTRKELRASDALAEGSVTSPVTKEACRALSYGMSLADAQAVFGGAGEQLGCDVMPGQETVTYGWPIRDGYVARLTFQDDVLVDVNLNTGIALVAMAPALSEVRLDTTLPGYRIVK